MSTEGFPKDIDLIFSEPFKMPDIPPPDPAKLEATALQAEKRRQRRMHHIVAAMKEVFDSRFPQDAVDFTLTFETVTDQINSRSGEMESVPYDRTPSYAVFLALKNKPERDFRVMQLFRVDVTANVRLDQIRTYYNVPAFSDWLGHGIQQLRSEESGISAE